MTEMPTTYNPLHCKSVEGTLYGNIQTHRDIHAFADMGKKGDLKLDNLISNTFKIDEINDVVEAMQKREIIGRWVCKWD